MMHGRFRTDGGRRAMSSEGAAAGRAKALHEAQALYTPLFLSFYDHFVLRFNSPVLWGCRRQVLLSHFAGHLSANHLDVGVGTGYFLQHGTAGRRIERLGLMDPNQEALRYAARRVEALRLEILQHDATRPVVPRPAPFSSISIHYLLHCIPGDLKEKACILDNLLPLLDEGGTLFGATILAHGVKVPALSRLAMSYFIRRGAMNNAADSLDDLRAILDSRLDGVELQVEGMVALFAGRKRAAAPVGAGVGEDQGGAR
jgi:SAM-dependent methyltransferase